MCDLNQVLLTPFVINTTEVIQDSCFKLHINQAEANM